MTTIPLRKDAARNWHRIVEVARQYVGEGKALQLNDVARAASVGVATVYRHFPTPEALMEAVAAPALEGLIVRAEQALAGPDVWTALHDFLTAAIDVQMNDASIAAVFAAPVDASDRTTELKGRVAGLFAQLLESAHAAGVIDPDVTAADMVPLMCGVAYAANIHSAGGGPERAATARRYLAILLEGLRRREG